MFQRANVVATDRWIILLSSIYAQSLGDQLGNKGMMFVLGLATHA
jgi:hypothetical protein